MLCVIVFMILTSFPAITFVYLASFYEYIIATESGTLSPCYDIRYSIHSFRGK